MTGLHSNFAFLPSITSVNIDVNPNKRAKLSHCQRSLQNTVALTDLVFYFCLSSFADFHENQRGPKHSLLLNPTSLITT